MKAPNLQIGRYLRELRKKENKTLHQVSKAADIDSPLLSKLERGERLPTLSQITKLAKYFKVAESDLKIMLTAEKIIKEYGANNTTYDAITIVQEQITPYRKK